MNENVIQMSFWCDDAVKNMKLYIKK